MKKYMAVDFQLPGAPLSVRRNVFAQLAHVGLFVLLTTSVSSHAQSIHSQYNQTQSGFEEDFDDSNKAWKEIAAQLPPLPKPENLLEFEAGRTASMTFAVDARSISVGSDSVVRYTLVSRSPSGAENISYEGIRCETQERKLYAFGHKDGNWTRSRRDKWERFTNTTANNQHATLARDYFCTHKVVDGNADEIMRRLRDKRPLAGEMSKRY